MKTITAQELRIKINNNEILQIIDVREDYEFENANIGGINIPLENVIDSINKIDFNQHVIFCCKTGKRSAAIIHTLERKMNLKNLFSLQGGVEGYLEKA